MPLFQAVELLLYRFARVVIADSGWLAVLE
jgi:hypothetical protein